MKSSQPWICTKTASRYSRSVRAVTALLALLLAYPASEAGLAVAQQAAQASAGRADRNLAENALPENPQPQSQQAQTQQPQSQQPQNQPTQGAPQNGQSGAPQSGNGQSQKNDRKPVGTAAAPYEPTVGVAGSRPSGAAIAPAKQRRVRTILISLGVIAGAGIAVGSVAALSHGSPSRP